MYTIEGLFKKCVDSEKFVPGVGPTVINVDHMPLHQNESATQKTLTFKNLDTYSLFYSHNYSLSYETAIVFMQISSDPTANFILEFVFKGKGTRTKLNPPEGMKVQWSDSGSFCK